MPRGSIPVGYETNTLDVLGDQGGWKFYPKLQQAKAAELVAHARSLDRFIFSILPAKYDREYELVDTDG